ncbi:MAG TPA: hypothetical protein VM571_05005, partial [Noviherbaspirillum sp.]|nr:hypothetical protein [Noviherbaspirillum sp.]
LQLCDIQHNRRFSGVKTTVFYISVDVKNPARSGIRENESGAGIFAYRQLRYKQLILLRQRSLRKA